ncbi:MAG: hypothetical protein ABIJ09_02885 [Pseudomonadota bacterium]
MAAPPTHSSRGLGWLVAAIALGAAIAVAGWWFQRSEVQRLRQVELDRLHAIGDLKAQWIADWREELLTDARRATRGPYLVEHAGLLVAGQASDEDREQLQARLRIELEAFHYTQVLLVTPELRVALAVPDTPSAPGEATAKAVREALASQRVALSEMFHSDTGLIVLDAVAPILDPQGQAVAALVLRTDASVELYPRVQSWPLPSRTAESLILKQQDDACSFSTSCATRRAQP